MTTTPAAAIAEIVEKIVHRFVTCSGRGTYGHNGKCNSFRKHVTADITAELDRLTAQLAASQAAATEAREKAIRECARLCTGMARRVEYTLGGNGDAQAYAFQLLDEAAAKIAAALPPAPAEDKP